MVLRREAHEQITSVLSACRIAAGLFGILMIAGVFASRSQADPIAPSSAVRAQSTQLISKPSDQRSEVLNGPSTHAVISNDRRYARLIAFESEASNLIRSDRNGVKDVFAVKRAGPIDNTGTDWRAGKTLLVSRARSGKAANGPSFSPAVDGALQENPSCVAFLSAASNLVAGDNNRKVDAFVSNGPGGRALRVSLPGGRQARRNTTEVAVSGDCSRIAFVTAGTLYVRDRGRRTVAIARGASDPSFSTGIGDDLVFSAKRGVYLSKDGTGRPSLVAPGGSNPAYNDIKRQVVAYEKSEAGHTQIFFRDLGQPETIVSYANGMPGNADSRNPVIGNSGYYITFQSDASNLGTNATGNQGDYNGKPDVYLYTGTRDLTLVQSVADKAVPLPGGGRNPSVSFYANYIVFDSPGPLGRGQGPHQVFMRYLGGL